MLRVIAPAPLRGFGEDAAVVAAPPPPDVTSGELATTMVLRGAFGTLLGAAVAPRGQEGVWGAAGFVSGAVLGQIGLLGIALVALWKKAGT